MPIIVADLPPRQFREGMLELRPLTAMAAVGKPSEKPDARYWRVVLVTSRSKHEDFAISHHVLWSKGINRSGYRPWPMCCWRCSSQQLILAALLGTSHDYAMAFDEGFTVIASGCGTLVRRCGQSAPWIHPR